MIVSEDTENVVVILGDNPTISDNCLRHSPYTAVRLPRIIATPIPNPNHPSLSQTLAVPTRYCTNIEHASPIQLNMYIVDPFDTLNKLDSLGPKLIENKAINEENVPMRLMFVRVMRLGSSIWANMKE